MLDLDGTLLGMSEKVFLSQYTELVVNYFTDKYQANEFLNYFWKATEHMYKDNNGTIYTIDSFFDSFGSSSGMPREEIHKRFDNFYRGDFKKLGNYSYHFPEARKIIETAVNKDIIPILATNPIFPEIATRERCRWANIDYDDFYFVSHAENSTFVKPNPKYYHKLLDIAEVKPENTLMVGNDYLLDLSAKSVGIHTWLTDKYHHNEEFKGKFQIDYSGSLSDLLHYIEKL